MRSCGLLAIARRPAPGRIDDPSDDIGQTISARRRLVNLSALAVVALLMAAPALASGEHRNRCHQAHACPSDHATYRWGPKRLLCVKPSSDARTSRFTIRVRYAGLPYLCRR